MSRETKITIETDSLLIFRGRSPFRTWCPECGFEAEMVPVNGVAVISNLTPPEIKVWIQSEDLHHSTGADGVPLICLNSMLKRIQKGGPA
jgi:hypothetical protein